MSQTKEILRALEERAITPVYALQRFGCLRLAARIKNLRDEGHNIITQMIEYNGRRFACYRLVKKGRAR